MSSKIFKGFKNKDQNHFNIILGRCNTGKCDSDEEHQKFIRSLTVEMGMIVRTAKMERFDKEPSAVTMKTMGGRFIMNPDRTVINEV